MPNFQPNLNPQALKTQEALAQSMTKTALAISSMTQNLGKHDSFLALERTFEKMGKSRQMMADTGDQWVAQFQKRQNKEEELAKKNLASLRSEHQLKLSNLDQLGARAQVQADQMTQNLKNAAVQTGKALNQGGQAILSGLGSMAAVDKKGTSQAGVMAGQALGASYGPWGTVAGGLIGNQVGAQLGQMAGNPSGSNRLELETDRLAVAFGRLSQNAANFEEKFKVDSMSTHDKVSNYQSNQQKLNDLQSQRADLMSAKQEAGEKLSYLSAKQGDGLTSSEKKEMAALQAQFKTYKDDLGNLDQEIVSVSEANQSLEQGLRLYARDMKKNYDHIRESQRQFFIGLNQQTYQAADFQGLAEQIDKAAQAIPVPTDPVELAGYYEKQAEMEEQKLGYMQQFVAKSKEVISQYKGIEDQIQNKITSMERQNWTSHDWLNRYNQLQGQKNGLNPRQSNYDQEMIRLSQEQASALSEMERTQKQEVAQNEQILASLQNAQKSVDQRIFELSTGGMSAGEAFGVKLERAASLFQTAISATGENKAQAVADYLAASGSLTSDGQQIFKSSDQMERFRQSQLELNQLLKQSLQGQMGQYQNGAGINFGAMWASLQSEVSSARKAVQAQQDQFLAQMRFGFSMNDLANLGLPQRADGGVTDGPQSGYLAILHGQEAVIPLKNGAIPVSMSGKQGDSTKIERLLAELIDVARAKGDGQAVMIDLSGLAPRLIQEVSEGSRMGRLKLEAK